MLEVIVAITQAMRELKRPGIWWHVLWPPFVALIFWLLIGALFWAEGMQLMSRVLPSLPWSGWEWLSQWAGGFLLLAALAALTFATALLLVAVVALPLLLNIIARRDYPDLVRHGENVFWRSLRNSLFAGAVFIIGSLLSLPLLLIPLVALVLPLLWATWLNQRTFGFDALAEHATAAELVQLQREQRAQFYLAGGSGALLAFVPVVQLFAPVFTALVFIHLGLAALRRLRQQQGVQL